MVEQFPRRLGEHARVDWPLHCLLLSEVIATTSDLLTFVLLKTVMDRATKNPGVPIRLSAHL